jgi:hypothetical protein
MLSRAFDLARTFIRRLRHPTAPDDTTRSAAERDAQDIRYVDERADEGLDPSSMYQSHNFPHGMP